MNFDQEKQRLLDIFKAFDSNNDGMLDKRELVAGYNKFFNGDIERAEFEASQIMSKLDFNGNGTIDYSEFMIANIDPAQLIQEEKLREIFELFDTDRSGNITIDEIKKVLGGNGKGSEVDETEWERIVAEVDMEGDGEISF